MTALNIADAEARAIADAEALARVRAQIGQSIQPGISDCATLLGIIDRLFLERANVRIEVELASLVERSYIATAAQLNDLITGLEAAGLYIQPCGTRSNEFGWIVRRVEGGEVGPYESLSVAVQAALTVPSCLRE